jgi:hypothetical protein
MGAIRPMVIRGLFPHQLAPGFVGEDVDLLLIDVLLAQGLAAILIGRDAGHDGLGG